MSGTLLNRLLLGAGVAAAADAAVLYARSSQLARDYQNDITFPQDLISTNAEAPFMSMEFSAYRRRSIYEQPFYETQMKINLPIPDNLVEQQGLDYKLAELGSVVGSIAEALSPGAPTLARAAAVASGVGAAATPRLAAGFAQTVAQRAGVSLTREEARQGVSQAGALIPTLFGITANPFQAVLFKSPDFRAHTFKWTFVPKNRDESETIRQLVETFKFHSLPGVSAAGGVFFSYPEILKISLRPRDQYLYKFKPCVVDTIAVNYAPNSPSFYKSTGAPTAVQFSIKLQEIEIWTKADWLRDANGRLGTRLVRG